MTTAVAHQWSRSKYPGHPSSQASTPPSPTTSQSDDGSIPPLSQLLEKVQVPWYHAVTEEPSNEHSNTVSNLSLPQSTEKVKEAFAYGSPPLRQVSCFTPPVLLREDPFEQVEEFIASSPGPAHSDLSRHSSHSWHPGAEQHQANNESSPVDSASSPSPEEPRQSSPVPASPERTLRRSLRSQRITSPIKVEPSSPKRINSESSTPISTSNPWKRQRYPVHAPVGDSPARQPPPPPYQQELATSQPHSDPASSEMHHRGSTSSNSESWHRQLDYSSRASTAVHTSPAHSDTEEEKHEQTSLPTSSSTDQPQEALRVAKLPKTYRRGYPLQSPASHMNLRRSPTPPQSSGENELAPTNKNIQQPHNNNQPAVPKEKPARRLPYPLQSHPSTHTDPEDSVHRPPSPMSEASEESDQDVNEAQPSQTSHPAFDGKTFRRAMYPLQTLTSTTNPRPPPSLRNPPRPTPKEASEQDAKRPDQPAAEPVAKSNAETPKGGPEERPQAQADSTVPAKHTFRRKGYPLQTMAGGSSTQPAQSYEKSSAQASNTPTKEEAEKSSSKPSEQPRQQGQNGSQSKPSYPLQAPTGSAKATGHSDAPSKPTQADKLDEKVNKTTVEDSPDRSPEAGKSSAASEGKAFPMQASAQAPAGHTDHPEEGKSAADKERERAIASKVIQQWRRSSYPMNSASEFSSFEGAPHEQEPGQDHKTSHKSKPIHLPKNLRAQKDSGDRSEHGRTIVLCLDGTGDKFDDDNSNIVHLVSSLKKDDPHQVTYYQAGIGTYGDNGLSSGFAAAADMAVGAGLGLHVRDAYHFLMHTYKEGDKICIFGFSRGAYTARCLAGMIHKVGLLPPRNIQQIPFAYQFYTADDEEGWTKSDEFKKTFCIDVNVYFLGCFDSVASVGFIPRQLPLSSTPSNKPIYFRHAMALDERRAKFKICRYTRKKWDDITGPASKKEAIFQEMTHQSKHILPNYKEQDDVPPGYHRPKRYGTNYHPNVTDEEYQDMKGHDAPFDTDVLEVWFAGAHADIGGGAVPNVERHKLAQIPLRWMIRQAFECNTGILFKTKMLAEFGLDIHTLWPKYEQLKVPTHDPPPSILEKYQGALPPRQVRREKLVPIDKHENGEPFYALQGHQDEDWTPELLEDYYDALSPLNDQLIQVPTWWVLEFMPVEYKIPVRPGEVQLRTGMNWGRYRGVEDVEPIMHWTVKHRVNSMNYRVLVRTAQGINWKVVT